MAILGAPLPTGITVDEYGVTRSVIRTFLNATAQGNTQIVAAQGTSVRVRVFAVAIVSLTALTVKFQSGTTDICSAKSIAANGGYIQSSNDHGWFQTAMNEALNVNLSGVGTVGVDIIWTQAG